MRIALPPSPHILVVVLQRLGDVLLTTPLIRSLKHAWPNSGIDVLVYAETAGILAGNPDIARVITMPSRPSVAQSVRLVSQLWNCYALAVSAQAGDRPTFFAFAAGRRRVAPTERRLSGAIKRLGLHRTVPAETRLHRVQQMLRLVQALGIVPVGEVVPPRPKSFPGMPEGPFAVVHATPMFHYKRWSVDGWRALVDRLKRRGLHVVATGGPAEGERQYLDAVWGADGRQVLRRDGALGWQELSGLLGATQLYVGPDTSVTHLAAATGAPTVAIYGPTDPVLWGPWPASGLETPWAKAGALQRRGNVWLVQQPLPCMPCQFEGCERRLDSYSRCLDEMPFQSVLDAAELALASYKMERAGASERTPV